MKLDLMWRHVCVLKITSVLLIRMSDMGLGFCQTYLREIPSNK